MNYTPDPLATAWLERFEESRRSLVANIVLNILRDRRQRGLEEGAMMPVTRAVLAEVERRYPRDAAFWTFFIGQIADHEAFAAYVADRVAWDTQTPAQKQHFRTSHNPQPPSDKQLAFLRRLGHTGAPPESMGEASRLIDSLVGGGRPR